MNKRLFAAVLSIVALIASDPAFAALDCNLIDPGDKVVTTDGLATVITCKPLLVRLENGSEAHPSDALPIMDPIPLDSPQWYGVSLDPNYIAPELRD